MDNFVPLLSMICCRKNYLRKNGVFSLFEIFALYTLKICFGYITLLFGCILRQDLQFLLDLIPLPKILKRFQNIFTNMLQANQNIKK